MPPKDGDKYPFLTRKMLAFQEGAVFGLSITLNGPAGATVAIRGFTKEGPFNLKVPIVTNGTTQVNTFKIPDIPVMLAVVDNLGNLTQGHLYAEVRLTVNDVTQYALCSGWVYKSKSISYPITQAPEMVPGRGRFTTITPSAPPAAGADINFTPETGFTYHLIGFRATLTTSATVATRRVRFYCTLAGNEEMEMFSLVDQVASLDRYYWGSQQAASVAAINQDIIVQIPIDTWLNSGDNFRSKTLNLQAGDSWDQIELVVEQFITT